MKGIWIRSQDREKLLFATDIRIGSHLRNYPISTNDHEIGGYKTLERSIEVLSEIQQAIADGKTVYEMPKE